MKPLTSLILGASITISGCQEKTEMRTPLQVPVTIYSVQWSCQELVWPEYKHTLVFWQKFVQNKYPSTQRWVMPDIIQALKEMENDLEFWAIARKIWKKYRWEAPKGTKDINAWALQQMWKNLWEILYFLVTDKAIDKSIRDALWQSIFTECQRRLA